MDKYVAGELPNATANGHFEAADKEFNKMTMESSKAKGIRKHSTIIKNVTRKLTHQRDVTL